MDKRTKDRIERELTNGSKRATMRSATSVIARLPEETQKELSKKR